MRTKLICLFNDRFPKNQKNNTFELCRFLNKEFCIAQMNNSFITRKVKKNTMMDLSQPSSSFLRDKVKWCVIIYQWRNAPTSSSQTPAQTSKPILGSIIFYLIHIACNYDWWISIDFITKNFRINWSLKNDTICNNSKIHPRNWF